MQGELEAVLATVLREPVELTVAGRTDAGVHAWGQVASFDIEEAPPRGIERSLNGAGPDDIAVKAVTVVPGGFDARRDAKSRTYCYRVLARPTPSPFERGRALWWPHPLDREALDACAAAIVGAHDFTAFTPTQTDHVLFTRTILEAKWGWDGEETAGSFVITGETFMRNMVRALVGTMLEVAGGRRSLEDFARLLEGAPRREAGETAPAHGLYLASVAY